MTLEPLQSSGREESDVSIFSLFSENWKPGVESERNWGLFYP